jgi:tight adherence protein B
MRGARKQRKEFAEQLPANLQDLAGAMRSGRGFVGAIGVVAETSTEPIKGELQRALRDEHLGLPLEDTLEAIGRRMQSKDMEQIALIAALNRNSGSNVAEALDRVADGARDRADLAREMRSLTGQARMSSWVLSGLPPVMLLGLTVIEPLYAHPLLHTTTGIVLLVIATVMVVAGWAVMRRICSPEV